MRSITPFLWFDGRAEEAVQLYTSVFRDSEVLSVTPGPSAGGRATVTSITVRLLRQRVIAFNGGPAFAFSPAASLFVSCETQDELDEAWEGLAAEGKPGRCGWLTDRFGLSWQLVPSILGSLLGDPDPRRAKRVLDAMLGMGRLDIAALRTAHEQP